MAVGDHQPHPGEAALCKGGEELAPAALGLAVAQLGTEPLTVPVSVYVVYVHRHDKGPAAVQIEGNVALVGLLEVQAQERLDMPVDLQTSETHLRLGNPTLHRQSAHTDIVLTGKDSDE